jgi:hypothetical protein
VRGCRTQAAFITDYAIRPVIIQGAQTGLQDWPGPGPRKKKPAADATGANREAKLSKTEALITHAAASAN